MRQIFFWIGTDAELIKIFPVIMECQREGAVCNIIATGQNDLTKGRILNYIKLNGKYVELSKEENIRKNARGLGVWFISTLMKAKRRVCEEYSKNNLQGKYLVVHGDTVSTMMGAIIGKSLGMKVCHVEAGLRSHCFYNPFPEEIDRMVTSCIARIHFAPGEEPCSNLKKAKGLVVNSQYNTILDSLNESQKMEIMSKEVSTLINSTYFVFVMHRQENLMNKEFVKDVISQIRSISKNIKCVLILHKITENTLDSMGLLGEIENDCNIVLLPRIEYFDFMKLLRKAQFVITDGGSNQEELYYMGKPCFILRRKTERREGIGENAVMFKSTVDEISTFSNDYLKYMISEKKDIISPSTIVASILLKEDL